MKQNNNNEKIVITYGTFDLFHYGHERILERVSKLGDKLIVAISSDKFNKLKGKKAHWSFRKRKSKIKKLPFVFKVIKEKNWEQKIHDVKKYNVNVFAMGDDWKGKFDYLKAHGVKEVVYLGRTKGISSTGIKEDLKHKSSDISKAIKEANEKAKKINN